MLYEMAPASIRTATGGEKYRALAALHSWQITGEPEPDVRITGAQCAGAAGPEMHAHSDARALKT